MILERIYTTLDRWAPPPSDRLPVAQRQSGAIPYSVVNGTPVFLLITSRNRGHWIFPKGRIAEGLQPWESAAIEAYEEAGVTGTIDTNPIGSYRSWKTRGMRRFVIEVEMYALRVENQVPEWRETDERYRHWATLTEASRLVTDRQIIGLVRKFARDIRAAQVPVRAVKTA